MSTLPYSDSAISAGKLVTAFIRKQTFLPLDTLPLLMLLRPLLTSLVVPRGQYWSHTGSYGYGVLLPSDGGYGILLPSDGSYGVLLPSDGGYGVLLPSDGGYGVLLPSDGGYGVLLPSDGGGRYRWTLDHVGHVPGELCELLASCDS